MKYVIADTKQGKLRGFEQDGVKVWRGIPYALPPIGKLRYKAPVSIPVWDGIRDALVFGNISFQRGSSPISCKDMTQAEDCLYLNIVSSASLELKKPVIFWIHGGGFANGAGSHPIYNGTSLAVNGNLIVVSINYRLGPLGFLKLSQYGHGYEDNLGLLDQIAALKWVKKNIEVFGGDPDNITVMGESAGAISISHLLSIPQVNKLFSRAIIESGSLKAMNTEEKAVKISSMLLKKLGIDENSIEKLEKVPVEKIMNAAEEMAQEYHESINNLLFAPIIDERTYKDPIKAIEGGAADGISILIGTNCDEGFLFTREEAIAKKITDLFFYEDSVRIAKIQSKYAHVYMYRFDYNVPNHPIFSKAVHSMEIPFVFNNLDIFQFKSKQSQLLSHKMQELWIAFVKNGKPNIEGFQWPVYDNTNQSTVIFNNEITVVNGTKS
jgi:para-nitrobenzyl esterase